MHTSINCSISHLHHSEESHCTVPNVLAAASGLRLIRARWRSGAVNDPFCIFLHLAPSRFALSTNLHQDAHH